MLSARVMADAIVVGTWRGLPSWCWGWRRSSRDSRRAGAGCANFWFRVIHLGMIGVVVAESLAGITCPLTDWEKQLRRLGGQAGYAGDFIGHWMHRLIFFHAEPWVFTAGYVALGQSCWPPSCSPRPVAWRPQARLSNDRRENSTSRQRARVTRDVARNVEVWALFFRPEGAQQNSPGQRPGGSARFPASAPP